MAGQVINPGCHAARTFDFSARVFDFPVSSVFGLGITAVPRGTKSRFSRS